MGRFVHNPHPLLHAPAFPIWSKHRGETYIVFVDETFQGFFKLNERGYFCYGVAGIPVTHYEAVTAEFASILDLYRKLLVPELKELKHTEFKRIPFPDRWKLACRIHDILLAHGCFVSGFYTPSRPFLLERVRTNIMDDMSSIPADHAQLLKDAAQRTKESWDGPGQSSILWQLLALPLAGVIHAMAGLGCKVRIVYDSREPREDRAVKAALQILVDGMPNVWKEVDGHFIGFDETGKSDAEVGLQIADIVAGSTRAFLDANPDLARHGASPKIITQTSDEPFMVVDERLGQMWKTGVITPMPNALAKRFFQRDPKGRSVLSCFSDVLMSGLLTCYSSWGTPRHLMFYDRIIFDQLD